MKKAKKNLYCPNCKKYPNNIIDRYLEPIEEERTYNKIDGGYELQSTNLDRVEFEELCGLCKTKLKFKDR